MQTHIRPQHIRQEGGRHLAIEWNDGKQQIFDVVELRRRCPCAVCLDEWTRKPLLDPKSIGEETRPVDIRSVGNYAMLIHFSDGHRTGIYTYEHLRSISQNPQ